MVIFLGDFPNQFFCLRTFLAFLGDSSDSWSVAFLVFLVVIFLSTDFFGISGWVSLFDLTDFGLSGLAEIGAGSTDFLLVLLDLLDFLSDSPLSSF